MTDSNIPKEYYSFLTDASQFVDEGFNIQTRYCGDEGFIIVIPKGDNMLTRQELKTIEKNLRKYPDPMPWDPVDSVRKLLAHTEALQLQIADLNKQLSQALTGRGK